ncbi:hypothetical protein [Tsukamurella sp. 1534]|uniref:hypothetical protein n=1 Tax=Tsukamurella sp. 1534 TaxID=1151061 RepID=UPI000307AA1F|nr:hypothetical protein [Tsukamurella sp. 1534]
MYSEPLTRAIEEAEAVVAAAPHIENEADLLEGMQYLAQGVAACVHGAFHFDKDHPFLLSGTGPFTKMGLDNPDTLYFGARVDGAHEYVVTGRRGTTCDISFQVLGGGEYTDDNVPASTVAFDDRELTVDDDGRFEVRFGPGEPGPGYYRLPPGKAQLVIREVFDDWSARRSTFAIARADTAGTPPPALTEELLRKRYAAAGKQLVNRVRTWLQFPKWFYDPLPVNTLTAPRLTPGGLATQYSSVGHYELGDHEALVITVPRGDAPYLGFQLGSLWYISLDYIHHQTSLNGSQAQVDPDGMIRIVVAEKDPGVVNWIETLGHRRGYLQFRWQRTARELTAKDGPTAQVVPVSEVASHLPHYEDNRIDNDARRARIAERQRLIGERMVG